MNIGYLPAGTKFWITFFISNTTFSVKSYDNNSLVANAYMIAQINKNNVVLRTLR